MKQNDATRRATPDEMAVWDLRFSHGGPDAHHTWSREKLIDWVSGIEPMLKRIWYALEPFSDEMSPGDLADNVLDLANLLRAERGLPPVRGD